MEDCLVTGASGFIGKDLVRELSRAGFSGLAVSRSLLTKLPPSWRSELRPQAFQLGTAVKTLIHLEVKQHVQNPAAADEIEFENVNVRGTEEWLKWAAERQVKRFIFFSSIKAAGDSPGCQDESSSSAPDTVYGKSKRAAEEKVMTWAAGAPGRSALILRPAVVYGPGNKANMFSFVDGIYRGRFFLVGKNENTKSLISIQNLIAAVSHLIKLPFKGTEVFYLTDKESYTVAQLAAMIQSILQRRGTVRSLPAGLAKGAALCGDLASRLTNGKFPITSNLLNALLENTHFSCEKLQRTGFVHPQSTREGLEEMIRWYLASHAKTKS